MKPLLITLALLRGFDLTTTQMIVARGGHEANPVLPQGASSNLGVGIGLTLGELVVPALVARHDAHTGKKIAWTLIILEGVVTSFNTYQLRRVR